MVRYRELNLEGTGLIHGTRPSWNATKDIAEDWTNSPTGRLSPSGSWAHNTAYKVGTLQPQASGLGPKYRPTTCSDTGVLDTGPHEGRYLRNCVLNDNSQVGLHLMDIIRDLGNERTNHPGLQPMNASATGTWQATELPSYLRNRGTYMEDADSTAA